MDIRTPAYTLYAAIAAATYGKREADDTLQGMALTATELGLLVALIAVGGIVVGGLIAGSFAIFSGWLDNRREHNRWLRHERYIVYIRVIALLERFRKASEATTETVPKVTPAQLAEKKNEALLIASELTDLAPNLFVVGPRKLSASFARCADALLGVARGENGADGKYVVLKAQFIRDSQDVLRAGHVWQRVTTDDAYVFKEIQKERSKARGAAPIS